jgi:NAD(P)H dehydrogenase (quinone)
MILITGASGQFGSATIHFLLKKGITPSTIKALVRSEEKAAPLRSLGLNIAIGDYNNYESLVQAMEGVNKLFLISSSEIQNRSEQQINAVKAAKEAGVKHIIYTSFERKDETASSPMAFISSSHIETEKAIKESGMTYTILRNSLYADTIPMFLGEKVTEQGVFFPAGKGAAAFATRSDMAEAAANILSSEGHENKEYSTSNAENYTFDQIAEYLSSITGKTIPNINPSTEVYAAALENAQVPALYIGMFAGFAGAIAQNEFFVEKGDLSHLLGRTPQSLKEYLTGVYGNK